MNIFIIYFETEESGYPNGQTVQCNTIEELIYQLNESLRKKYKNINIHTIINGKPQ